MEEARNQFVWWFEKGKTKTCILLAENGEKFDVVDVKAAQPGFIKVCLINQQFT